MFLFTCWLTGPPLSPSFGKEKGHLFLCPPPSRSLCVLFVTHAPPPNMSLFPVKMVPEGGGRRDASPHFYRCCPIIVHMDIFAMVERGRSEANFPYLYLRLPCSKKKILCGGRRTAKKERPGRSTSCILNFRKRGLNFVFFKNRIILCLGVYYFN